MSLFGRNTSPAHQPSHTVKLTKDPAGAPAVSLQKVRDDGHLDLAKRADKAGLALSKRGLSGIRAQAVLVLDHSGSMFDDYASGAVQTLVERALGFALQIDVDGIVPVLPFDSTVHPEVRVGLAADPARRIVDYRDVVNQHIWHRNHMGSTNLASALHAVRDLAASTTDPTFCFVVTDGEPNQEGHATQIVCDLAEYPVFLKFLALRPVEYLQYLDDLPADRRLLDNADTQPGEGTNLNLLACTDMQFADAAVEEWDTWITAATAAGVLS